MLSEARAPLVQSPIAMIARRLLASDVSVQAVMVMGNDGRVLVHERAIKDDELDSIGGEDYPLFFYDSKPGLLFFVRLNKQPTSGGISDRIISAISSPSFSMTP
ncbi:MAG TPA: hypothetical protein VIW22_06095 [Nitrososphaerales archaeon]